MRNSGLRGVHSIWVRCQQTLREENQQLKKQETTGA